MKEIIIYRGVAIEIIQDDMADSPDKWDNDDAFLVYDHRQFSVKRKGFEPREIFDHFQETKQKTYDGYWCFTVNAYIHSGVALSLGSEYPFNDQWDVSTTGFALVQRKKGWTWTREKARKVAEAIVAEWNQYLSGEVYGYNIEASGDSCWGYYGEYDSEGGCLDAAKDCVDVYIKNQRESHYQQLKTWIRNKVPALYRQPMKYFLTL